MGRVPNRSAEKTIEKRRYIMRQNDRRRRLFKTFTACLLALAMLLTNVMGVMEVRAEGIPAPTITKAFIGTNTISGGNVHVDKVSGKVTRGTVHVTLKDKSGAVKADNLTFTPKSGKNWTVDLPAGVTIAEGDTVTAYQEFDGQKSTETTANAEPSKAYENKDKLKMPTGEIWIEQTSSNIVNEDEQAEAVQMLKDANTEIAGDIKSVVFSINTAEHAYYEVTYTDGSTSGKVEAPDLKIQTVTETSAAPTIEKVQVTDGQIVVTFENEVAAGTKFYFVSNFTDGEEKGFCKNGSCVVDKSTSKEMSQAVSIEGKKVTFPINDKVNDLKLGKEFGIVVKEPHKFRSCAKKEPVVTTPAKVEVRDPKNLTDADKKAIDKAIREANTVNGVSKLPDGTGNVTDPAFIEFDKDGNVTIISPNDVEVTWDSNYNPVYVKNDDGTYKVNDGAKVIKIPAKDLVKNIKPDAPKVALSEDKKSITITPNLDVDTDAKTITVSYKDKDGNDQTTTATKADDGTWSITGEGTVVNGVITLPKDKVKGNTDVTATVTDKGGIAKDDTTPLASEPGTLTVEETIADKVEALGGLDPVALKKWVGDTVDWKDGVKAKDSATEENKGKINELLKGATFEDVTEENRSTSKEGDFEGKIKITFDDKSELVVEKQFLYVSNHVTSMKRKEKVPTDALDVEFKLGEGTKVNNTDGTAITGDKENPTSYQSYKVKPGTNVKEYTLPIINASVIDSIKVTPQEGYTEPVWAGQDTNNPKNFVASDTNKVFTATATKTYDITFDANTGTGTKDKVTLKKDDTYTLPPADTFTAPENMQFSGWQVGEDSQNLKNAGDQITITDNVTVKAIWKPIELKVNFLPGTGASGEMTDVPVNKGSDYKLPDPTFKAPENQEFAGWKVGNEDVVKKAGETIKITDNVTLTATWKDIEYKVTFDGNKGTGSMDSATVKKGEKYKLPDNTFGAPSDKQEFKTWEIDGKEVAPGTEITVEKDTEVKAIWKDIEYKVTFNGNEGTGKMDTATVKKGEKYKLPDNSFGAPSDKQEFKTWEIDGKEVAPGTEITVEKDTEVKAIWKDIEYKVTFDGNGGEGSIDPATVKKGEKYKLPDNSFGTPPDKKEFKTWEIDGKEVAPGTEITVDKDTVVKAIWKDKAPAVKEFKVTFNGNGGTDKMDPITVKKGQQFELPKNGFTAPKGKVFAGWQIAQAPNKVFAPGTMVTVNGNMEVKAIWKDITSQDPSQPGNGTFYMGSTLIMPNRATEPAKPAMEIGRHIRYLYGYEDRTVRPQGKITRAEAAALIARLAELDMSDKSKPDFADTPSAWYNSAINIMVKKDLMFGDKNGNFRPNEPITRGEFARALLYIDAKNDKVAPFADVKGHQFEAAINQAFGNGRINGYPDGTFRPDDYIQRAEAARMLNQYANRGTTLEGMAPVAKDLARFTDIDESHWAYCEIMEAANSHEYQRVKGTQVETWLKILYDDMKK